jgi:hypothetical protein
MEKEEGPERGETAVITPNVVKFSLIILFFNSIFLVSSLFMQTKTGTKAVFTQERILAVQSTFEMQYVEDKWRPNYRVNSASYGEAYGAVFSPYRITATAKGQGLEANC